MSYQIPAVPIDTRVFPEHYAIARAEWLERLAMLELPSEHAYFPCRGGGPDGDLLVTDVVWIGPSSARRLLVLIGGTHGIEGFAGSAVQLDFMRLLANGEFELPDDVAVILIHALNPWGYAWLRRCDEDGVDLNRNFVDFSQTLPPNAHYDELRPWLFIQDIQKRKQFLAEWQSKHGRTALELAISAGQYHDASGPFYGGTKPAHGRDVIEHIIEKFALADKTLAVIDIHTGLGQYGYGEIICDHAPDSAGTKMAQRWYGDSVALPLLGTSTSVPKTGLLDYAWHQLMNAQSCYVTLEFGTFSTDALFEVLLEDQRVWALHDPLAAHAEHGQIMHRHFCPQERAWQEMVLFRARQVIAQGLFGVAN